MASIAVSAPPTGGVWSVPTNVLLRLPYIQIKLNVAVAVAGSVHRPVRRGGASDLYATCGTVAAINTLTNWPMDIW